MREPPLVALTVGDPAGIGPEIVRASLPEVAREMRVVVVGPAELAPPGVRAVTPDLGSLAGTEEGPFWCDPFHPGTAPAVELGRAQAAGGLVALAGLRLGADWARTGRVDALVTAPVSKEAMGLAGERVEGQTELLARWDLEDREHGATGPVEMLAVAGRLRVLVLTRHLPLREALAAITADGVHHHLHLLARGLREHFGIERPRLALAGLNPHAGENGLLGREELDVLAPALERARAEGLLVEGPVSPDAVFAQALAGAHDGVLALYHDQGFIPVKLAAPEESVTILLGLSYLRLSPAHGTAFDLAGTGRARATNLVAALREAARLVRARRSAATGA